MAVYLITGSASGIGRHLTEVFYQQGHNVVATDSDDRKLRELTTGWPTERVLTTRLDVRSPADWQRVVAETLARWGRIDVGLNVAGVIRPGYVTNLTTADIDLTVDVNLKGVMHGTQALATQMVAQGGGHIVNIASLAGVAPIQGLSTYSATKCAVRAFSLAVAGELRRHNVVVSVVCPDVVDTDMLTQQLGNPAAALTFSGGRVLTVQDVARAVQHDALARGRLEVLLPPGRGWLGKLGNLFPTLGLVLTDRLRQKGLTQQQRLARARSDAGPRSPLRSE